MTSKPNVTTPPIDLEKLAAKIDGLPLRDQLLMAIALLEAGKPKIAGILARNVADAIDAARLLRRPTT